MVVKSQDEKKEDEKEKYLLQQKEWVKRNGVDEGSLLRVARIPKSFDERGWCFWPSDYEDFADFLKESEGIVGNFFRVNRILPRSIALEIPQYFANEDEGDTVNVSFPFFCLRATSSPYHEVLQLGGMNAVANKESVRISYDGIAYRIHWQEVESLVRAMDAIRNAVNVKKEVQAKLNQALSEFEGLPDTDLALGFRESLETVDDFDSFDSDAEYESIGYFNGIGAYSSEGGLLFSDGIKFGCQFVPWKQVERLDELRKYFTTRKKPKTKPAPKPVRRTIKSKK